MLSVKLKAKITKVKIQADLFAIPLNFVGKIETSETY